MKRIALLATLALGLLLLVVPASAFAQDAEGEEYVLNLGTLATRDTPWGQQLRQYKRMIEEKSGGRIRVVLHLGGRKGDELSMMRKLQSNDLQAFGGSTGAVASLVPEMAIFELPYLFDDADEADRIIDDVLTPPISEILEANGFKLYIMAENGFRNFATQGVAIHSPADLAPLKMRSQELWVHAETYRALGGNPVIMPVSEVNTALTTSNINGFDNTPLYAFAAGWYKQIDHWTVSDHIYQPATIIYNKDWFDGLPADLQEVLMSDRELQTKLGRKLVRKMNEKLIEQLSAQNITVYTMTAAERSAMAAATRPVHAMYVEKVGGRAQELLDAVYDAQ